ncbi:MAG: hypothetical protein K0M60_21450 [Hydrogenophaga sp.]|nr:hypothetical protein [Hydrogenophaga sp.]
MRRITGALFATLSLLTTVTSPAIADDAELAAILFGRNYNDGVMAVSVWPGHANRGEGGAAVPTSQTPARLRAAQAEVAADPTLQAAIARRNIALHNVVWVETAANGGRILYYR